MKVSFLSLKDAIKDKAFPYVVISGDDAFLRKKALETVFNYTQVSLPELNYITYDETVKLTTVLSSCRALPFGSERKLVAIDFSNADKLYFSDAERKDFISYLSNPPEYCCLVITTLKQESMFDHEQALQVDCSRLDKAQCAKWIKSKLALAKKDISFDTAEKIAEYCLCDMTRIYGETEKLSCIDNTFIDAELVENLVPKDFEYRAYELSESIATGKSDKALTILSGMLRDKEEPTSLLGLIYSYYRRLYYISVSKGLTVEQMAQNLGVKPFAVQTAMKVAKKYGSAKLAMAIKLIEQTEAEIKETWGRDRDYLELVVFNLINL